jgi:membrane-associated phospholipid phosphatase
MSARIDCAAADHAISRASTGAQISPVAAAAGLLVALGLLTGLEMMSNAAAGFDSAVRSWVLTHRSGLVSPTARALTYSGTSDLLYPLVALAGLAVRIRTGRWAPAVAALSVVVTGVLSRLALSKLVRDPRPPRADWLVSAGGFSFPSGHAATSTLVAGALAWLLWGVVPARWARIVVAFGCLGWALLVSLSRIYLGVHWISDVIGSWLLAGAWLAALLATGAHLARPRSGWRATGARGGSGA